MAKTLAAAFQEFKSHLEITNRQETCVADQRREVEAALRANLSLDPTHAPRVIGSWDRNTLIAPLSDADVDLFVILNSHDHRKWRTREGTIQALDTFRSILATAYPQTEMRRDQHCMTLRFREFWMDVIPTFRVSRGLVMGSGAAHHYYVIPDSISRQWIPTNPHQFTNLIREQNARMNETFIPLIKMVKGWNRSVGLPLKGLHIEVLLYRHYTGFMGWFRRSNAREQHFSYPFMLHSFFGNLSTYLHQPCFDPIMHDRIDTYLDNAAKTTKRAIAQERARQAAQAVHHAFDIQQRDQATAIAAWRTAMGEAFPAYG